MHGQLKVTMLSVAFAQFSEKPLKRTTHNDSVQTCISVASIDFLRKAFPLSFIHINCTSISTTYQFRNKLNNFLKITGILNNVFRPQKNP